MVCAVTDMPYWGVVIEKGQDLDAGDALVRAI
jgi:hypothetical protein